MIGGLLKSASSTALFAALGIVALSAGVPAAKAADLGGGCCADLEERVAELEATTARKGNRKVSLTVSGQVATAVLAWDDGDESDVYVVDNTAAAGGSGFGFSGSAAITPNLTAGFQLNIGISTGSRMNFVNQDDDDPTAANDSGVALTYANWYLNHSQLGRLTVGRANTATAGVSSVDLGGAGVIANAGSLGYWNAGFQATPGGTWGDAMGGGTVWGSGLSRGNVVSYSSPVVGGFSVSAAWGEDDLWDVALRYAGEFSGFRVAGAVGYIQNHNGFGDLEGVIFPAGGDEHSQVKGSLSVMHVASGLYLTGAFVDQDGGDGVTEDTLDDGQTQSVHDATLWYVQGGISKNWTGLGNTVLYGEYANIEASRDVFDASICGGCDFSYTADTDVWGLGVVQHVDAAAMELFLSYRNYNTSVEHDFGTNDAEIDMVVGGARVKF